jgi:hypothetical protein
MEDVAIDILKFLLSKKHDSANGLPSVNHIFKEHNTPIQNVGRVISGLAERKYAIFKGNTFYEKTTNQNFGYVSLGFRMTNTQGTVIELTLDNIPIEGQILQGGEDYLDELRKHEEIKTLSEESLNVSKDTKKITENSHKIEKKSYSLLVITCLLTLMAVMFPILPITLTPCLKWLLTSCFLLLGLAIFLYSKRKE